MFARKTFYALAICVVMAALLTPDVEARRKILKGRKTVTRTYYTEPSLPSWAIILIIAICEIIVGAIIFLIMKKRIIDVAETYAGSYNVNENAPLRSAY